MKRNKLFILGICTVMVALVSLSLVSGTWARYTSSVSASDSARVAKWAWEIGDKKLGSETVTFDLFNTIYDSNLTDEEQDVDTGLIAPGTGGVLSFSIENLSEVNALYSVHFTSTETVAQIQYSTDKTNWKETIAELNVTDQEIDMNGDTATITVYWQWRYNVDDATNTQDTTLGFDAASSDVNHEVSVYFSFTQVD